jgi:peptidylprolyl isomerase
MEMMRTRSQPVAMGTTEAARYDAYRAQDAIDHANRSHVMQAKSGDRVRVHYTGTLGDGSQFDSSRGRNPMTFTIGSGDVIAGFDAAVTGMTVGESRTVTIPAAEAYGPVHEAMVVTIPRAQIPPDMDPQVGQQFQLGSGNDALPVVVREVTPEHVVLDGNHPLAGQDLTFALELVGIEPRAS